MTEKIPESFWKVPDPRGLLGQTRAVALMRSDKRASYKHFALIEFHWGWAHKDYDWTSLASVRRMHAELAARDPLGGNPMSLPHINSGNRDLCEWGWLFELEKGAGRTASRFMPNFTLFDIAEKGNFSQFLNGEISFSVNPLGIRKGFAISVHPMGNSRVTYGVNTNAFSVHPLGNKDPLTGTVLKDGPTESGNDCAPATPPPTVGLVATAADGAQDGFEELWKAYFPKRGQGTKAKAREVYEAIKPSAEQHLQMVESARLWFAAWDAQGKQDAARKTLEVWLRDEHYECEPPKAYQQRERKAKATKPKTLPANDNAASEPVRIIAIEELGDPFGEWGIRITVDDDFFRAQTFELAVYRSGGNAADYDVYRQLLDVAHGIQSDLLGRRIQVETDGSRLTGVKVAKPAARYVQIAEADTPDGKTVSAVLEDINDKPEGRLELDWDQVLALCKVLGIADICDTDELLFKDFVIDEHGQFISVEEFERAQEASEKDVA